MRLLSSLASKIAALPGVQKQLNQIVSAQLPAFSSQVLSKHGMQPSRSAIADIARLKNWAYVCIDTNANAVGTATLRLYATRSTGQEQAGRTFGQKRIGKTVPRSKFMELQGRFTKAQNVQQADEIEEIFDHPLINLLSNMNPRDNATHAFKLLEMYMDLTGNNYWWVENDPFGVPMHIWPLASHLTRIVPGAGTGGDIVKGYLYGLRANPVRFDAPDVIQFRYPNPQDPYFYGLSPLSAGAPSVDRYTRMDMYESNLLENNGMSDFVVKYGGTLTEKQRRSLEQEWNQMVHGAHQKQRVKVADSEFNIEKLDFTPQEMSYLLSRKWTREEICGIYRVPLALVTAENVNRANMLGALTQYAKFGILPRLNMIEETLNQDLVPRYNEPRLFLAFDSPVPEDKVLKLKQDESDLKNFVKSVNEVRAQRGDEPADWGWEPLAQLTVGPISTTPDDTDDKDDDPAKQYHAKASTRVHKHFSCYDARCKADDVDRDLTGGPNPRVSPNEQRIMDAINETWKEQSAATVAAIAAAGGVELARTISENEKWTAMLAEKAQPTMLRVFTRGGNVGLAEAEIPLETVGRAGITLAEWIDAPEVVEAVDAMTLRFADNTSEMVKQQLTEQLQAGLANGEDSRQIAKRMREVFKGLDQEQRALMIARTETKRATDLGKISAWKQSGVVTGKVWDAANDACPFCKGMEAKYGQTKDAIGLEDNYWNEGDQMTVRFGEGEKSRDIHMSFGYSEVKAPPLHPNCRCELRPIVAGA